MPTDKIKFANRQDKNRQEQTRTRDLAASRILGSQVPGGADRVGLTNVIDTQNEFGLMKSVIISKMVVTRSLVLERLTLTMLEQILISAVFPLVIIYSTIPCSSSTTGSNMLGFCQGYQGAKQGEILSLDRHLSLRGVRQGRDADEVERSSIFRETEDIQSVPAAEREREKRRKRKRQEEAGKRLEGWRQNKIAACDSAEAQELMPCACCCCDMLMYAPMITKIHYSHIPFCDPYCTAAAEDTEGGGRQQRIWTIGGRIREISIFGSK